MLQGKAFRWLWVLVFLASCQQRQGNSQLDEQIQPESETGLRNEIYFNFPGCVPNCSETDRAEMNRDPYMLKKVVQAVTTATKKIDFSMYTFSQTPIFDALVAAADRGVVIRGVVDKAQFRNLGKACTPDKGCQLDGVFATPEYLEKSVKERLQYIEEKKLWPEGAHVTEKLAILFHKLPNGSNVKPAPGSYIVHNKLVIIDGQWLLSGSGNWSSTGLSINLENLSIFSQAENPDVLKAFQCMVETLWSGDANVIKKDLRSCQSDRVFFTPMPEADGIVKAIVDAADRATKTIDVSVAHLTNWQVVDALERAIKRGVKFRFVADDDSCNAAPSEQFQKLLAVKGDIRYIGTNCSMYQLSHNKFGIFDGKTVINGSGNWSKSGLTSNYENFVILHDPQEIGVFQSYFEKAWQTAKARKDCSCDVNSPDCRAKFCLDRNQRESED